MKDSTTFPWSVAATHDFGFEVAGTVSIWVLNQGLCCSESADIEIHRSNGDWASIQQFDNGGFQARLQVGTGPESDVYLGATFSGWHLFQIRADSTGVTIALDGNTVLTNPSITAFRNVGLNVWGGPGGTAYFDDFSVTLAGTQGPAGPQGPQGPQGIPGLAGLQYITGTPVTIGRQSTGTATAACPAGLKIIVGGYSTALPAGSNANLSDLDYQRVRVQRSDSMDGNCGKYGP